MSIEVIGLGALNMDHIHRVARILADGETVVDTVVSSPGGSAANTIYGLARLGVTTGFVGVVGDDDDGTILVRDFQKVRVDVSQIKVNAGARTGAVLCLSDQLGQRSLYVIPGANNRLTIDFLDITYINQARILHLSSFAGDKQFQLTLELMQRLDSQVYVSFAPGALYAARGLESLTPILARTYVLFINREEISQLTGQDITTGAETCIKCGCHIVAVTLGKGMTLQIGEGASRRQVAAAAYIKDARNGYVIEPASREAVSEVDTTGAGDAFAAGFLYGILNHKRPAECGKLGSIVARFCIARLGTRQGFPTLAQLAEDYRQLYNKQL